MAPSSVGPGFRATFAAIKEWQEDTGCAVSTAGSANAYTLNVNSDPYSGAATFADGDWFCFVASFSNTSAATLNVESEGAKEIRKFTTAGEAALSTGDILQNGHYVVSYDASADAASGGWIIHNATAGGGYSPGGTDVALADGGTGASLSDPGADRVFFWDDSETSTAFLAAGGNVSISATTVSVIETYCIAYSDETTAITATADKAEFQIPYAFTVTSVFGTLTTAQATGNIFTVDIHESGTTILSTKLTIDNTEDTSATALAPAVISDASLAANAPLSIDVDQIGDGTGTGGKVCLRGTPT